MSRHLGLWHSPSHCPPLTPYGPPLPTLRARAQKPREVNDSSKSSDQPWLLETLGNRLENIKWLWINRGAALTLSFTKKREEVFGQFLSCFAYWYWRISLFFFFLFFLVRMWLSQGKDQHQTFLWDPNKPGAQRYPALRDAEPSWEVVWQFTGTPAYPAFKKPEGLPPQKETQVLRASLIGHLKSFFFPFTFGHRPLVDVQPSW